MKKFGLFVSIAVSIFAISGCGGGAGTGSGDATTRPLTGSIGTASGSISGGKFIGKGESYGCMEDICKVIATDTSGETVMDDDLVGCAFELDLEIGKSYMISFVDCNDEWVAGMSGVFKVETGEEIDLGTITISGTLASPEHPFDEFMDTDGDGTPDYLDDDPCGGVSCDILYSCKAFGYSDTDANGLCDEFEDENWDSDSGGWGESSVPVECENDTDCAAGEICAICEEWGMSMCVLQTDLCSEGNPCKAGQSCYTACSSPEFGFCYENTTFGLGCAGDVDCVTLYGEGWTCDTEVELSVSKFVKHFKSESSNDEEDSGAGVSPSSGEGACMPPDTIECEISDECWMIGGACVEGICTVECYSDEECGEEGYCFSSICIYEEITECAEDGECDEGELCISGICMYSGMCTADEDCTDGFGYDGFACEDGYCIYTGSVEIE